MGKGELSPEARGNRDPLRHQHPGEDAIENPGQDPVEEARSKLLDTVQDPDATVPDALDAFRDVKKAKKAIGMSGINFLAGLRDDASDARTAAVDESVAAAFGAISSAFNEGINAAVDEMGRRVDAPSVKRNIALEGPVARTDLTPAQRRRFHGRVIDRPER